MGKDGVPISQIGTSSLEAQPIWLSRKSNELKQFRLYPVLPPLPHPPLTALPPLLLLILLLVQLQSSFQVILTELLAVAAHIDELPGTLQIQARAVLGV
eukprot:1133769-Pelagomonas_calceolata.AAC.1